MKFTNSFNRVKPAYEIPTDDLVGEVIVPAMRLCDEVRIEAGFFSSRCLAQIAPGLAAFINDGSGEVLLMASPEVSEEDRRAIRLGIKSTEAVMDDLMSKIFVDSRLSGSAVERHAVETLAYLVASGRLRIRVVLMDRGMYHKKLWLFRSNSQWLAIHGSGNATERGLLVNGEQMSIDRARMDGARAEQRVRIFAEQWDKTWNNDTENSLTIEIEQALDVLRDHAPNNPPTAEDFWEAWRKDHEAGLEPVLPPNYRFAPLQQRLRIPETLVWREGRFAHQGAAVDAILKHGGGILSIATGGGKTLTALIAASELQQRNHGHLCVVVLAPSRPLVSQWATDVRGFGVEPVTLSGMSNHKRIAELERISVAFNGSQPRTEVLILTNSLFFNSQSTVREWIAKLPDDVICLLIADEVHNLGAQSFVENLPDFFNHRIGLSATPVRQYDPDGTDNLFSFFGGEPVFEFSLRDAIRSGCLVPYQYHIHPVKFTDDEMEYYEDLTARLAKLGFRVTEDGKTIGLTRQVETVLRQRRALVEQADAKIAALKHAIMKIGPESVSDTLIYTSAKPTVLDKSKQIDMVNALLNDLHINFHQFTAKETGTKRSQSYLEGFGAGGYQALTAMKVLDEGIDIPQVDTAFLLASSAVEREWVQRRGRILRNAPGKEVSQLHDFIVTPPSMSYPHAQTLLQSEIRRARAFAELAENEYDAGGANSIIRSIEHQIKSDIV